MKREQKIEAEGGVGGGAESRGEEQSENAEGRDTVTGAKVI